MSTGAAVSLYGILGWATKNTDPITQTCNQNKKGGNNPATYKVDGLLTPFFNVPCLCLLVRLLLPSPRSLPDGSL